MRKIILFIGCVILFGIFLTQQVHAQSTSQPLNLTTTPDVFDITANPGDSLARAIRIRNNNLTPTDLKITVEKIIPDKNGNLILQDFQKQDDYASWLTIPASISALPREWTDIPFSITLPKSASFGYYFAILISNKSTNAQNGATTHITGAVAIPVLLTVNRPGMIFNAKLLSFTTDSGWYEYLPTTFLTTLKNMSNVLIRPAGTLFITDTFGNSVAKISFNQDAGSMLPNAQRTYQTIWNDSFITYDPKMEDGKILVDAKGKPEMQVNFHFDRVLSLRIGKYTATALIVVSGDKKDLTFQQTMTFFVFPWKIVLGLLFIILFAFVGIWSILSTLWQQGKRIIKKE